MLGVDQVYPAGQLLAVIAVSHVNVAGKHHGKVSVDGLVRRHRHLLTVFMPIMDAAGHHHDAHHAHDDKEGREVILQGTLGEDTKGQGDIGQEKCETQIGETHHPGLAHLIQGLRDGNGKAVSHHHRGYGRCRPQQEETGHHPFGRTAGGNTPQMPGHIEKKTGCYKKYKHKHGFHSPQVSHFILIYKKIAWSIEKICVILHDK